MRVLGLDLGTNSVGWALVQHEPGQKPTALYAGSYVFPEAGEITSGLFESNRRKRGEKRRQRRNLRRKRQRRDELVKILVANRMLPEEPAERTDFLCKEDPYALRRKGLDDQLTLMEFGRCLYHIGRRRGYLSTALLKIKSIGIDPKQFAIEEPSPTDDEEIVDEKEKQRRKDEGVMLTRIREIRDRLEAGEARTIGEFYAKHLANREPVRGYNKKDKTNKALKNPNRDVLGMRADRIMFEEEFHKLWEAQARHHRTVLTPALKARVFRAIFWQRQLRAQKFLVGNCPFYPNRKRADRASLASQRNTILQYLNTLRVHTPGEAPRRLTGPEIVRIANALELTESLTWKEAAAVAGLSPNESFSDDPGDTGKSKTKSKRGRKQMVGNRTASAIRKAIGKKWDDLTDERRESLVTRLITCNAFENIARRLRKEFGFDERELYNLATAELPEGYANHCTRVLNELRPHLESGKDYFEACVAAGYRNPNESTEAIVENPVDRLPYASGIRNPMVERSVNGAIKVINAIVERHGKPDRIRIELPREISRTNKQRQDVWKRQELQAKERDAVKKKLEEEGFPATERNIKKVRLWQEAGCSCPYEPDRTVTLSQLMGDYDIDHIVPRSRCYDDSWGNLTICPFSENAAKSNKTPYETWGHMQDRWRKIEVHVSGLRGMPERKRERILRKEWEDAEFTNRALTETSYISTEVVSAVKALGVAVEPSRGGVTAMLREMWQVHDVLPPSPEESDAQAAYREKRVKKEGKQRFDHRHHALDAIIVALTDIATLQAMTRYYKEREAGKRREDVARPKPWDTFTEDVRNIIEVCPVVHQPTRGIGGKLHQETALTPPPQEKVDAALARLPENVRSRIRNCVVVGPQLVWLDENGRAYKAYDLANNHHCVIWEPLAPNKKGEYVREIEVVPMIEAARRAEASEPVIKREREGYRYVMSLCKNDVVEWTGDNPGYWRVAAIGLDSVNGAFEVTISPLRNARKVVSQNIRVRTKAALCSLRRRVTLDPLGNELSSEPGDPDD